MLVHFEKPVLVLNMIYDMLPFFSHSWITIKFVWIHSLFYFLFCIFCSLVGSYCLQTCVLLNLSLTYILFSNNANGIVNPKGEMKGNN
ncbi:hypothetical protein MtrunA17_Chr1g0168421 [Medicago truncatula]|uniref:Transmembrane protein n=1 Tax=Medicago truncatula TaxID=3880 RepID=A0A396JKA1_MEDTR|nr:hypothetical protein MtrunA17_Chr1g0168421 [Medicago truncatula]